ncbi:Dehydrodolichyl diphosphate synthase 6 [Striga hermonthica]|uniref:Alkyl transferase n=1 Tax=Striga hermonthica TaxID=68872 RepID=A0A9N7R9M1_STRHE|nr:Dehydrodolichyl diphosphate synthase 6 [Striga hermonthica]
MEKRHTNRAFRLLERFYTFLRRFIFSILSVGPTPDHIAFIMDGNRRYAKWRNLRDEGSGHRAGFSALMKMLQYCYELNVKHVTIYAFSIDNFKRRPDEVQSTMQLIQEKIEGLTEEESMVNRHGVRVNFIGNLKLLSQPVKLAAERAMRATEGNSRAVLSICLAYTSTDEIVHSVENVCIEKKRAGKCCDVVDVADVDRGMYMAGAPDVDVLVRSSGETRLSNFLLWQSACALLYSPRALWPEIGFRHLVRAVLDFQRNFVYLEKKRKQSSIERNHRD